MIGGAAIRSLSGFSYLPGGASRRQRSQQGFSLVELMIGVVLVAVLLGIGMPAFRSFILEQRLRATSSDLRVALMTARSEAVKRNREVELLPNADGWSKGWTIPSPPDLADPDLPLPAILNHVRAGDVTVVVRNSARVEIDEVDFTPAGRAKVPPGRVQLEIDIDPEDDDKLSDERRFACLERQLDGRVHSCRGVCPNPAVELPEPCVDDDESRTL